MSETRIADDTPTQINIQTLVEAVYEKAFQATAARREHPIINGNIIRDRGTGGWPAGTRLETFCGTITPRLIAELENHLLIVEAFGKYTGPGMEYSEDFCEGIDYISHVWCKLADGTIIDGSYGQFKPRIQYEQVYDRCLIIPPGDPRQEWYKEY